MTGFRNKELEEKLKTVGAKSGSSVNKSTFALLVKDKDASSGKVEDAKKYNVPIYSADEFTTKYF
jgi:NAD-dependent DNA ligase